MRQLLKDLAKERLIQSEAEEVCLKPWLDHERFNFAYTDAMQAMLTLGMIYGVDPSTTCLF